jgi:hypothetical protein
MAEPGADAHRQTTFVLGAEVELLGLGLEAEGIAAAASAGAAYRKQPTAAALATWSRAWLSRVEALEAVRRGNYAAALPLLRAAADYTAAEIALLETDAAEWQEWLDGGGIALAPEVHATQFELHPFRSAETLAGHPELGRVYREATQLAMPHFGATILAAGNESTPQRVLVTFGDRDFHLGLAEIALGWLWAIGIEQVQAIAAHPRHLAPAGEPAETWLKGAAGHLARPDRCGIEHVEQDGVTRMLIHGWRKRPGDAPRRILL